MPRSVLPSEDCVFRLDSSSGFKQQFPMTFNDVGLGDDGFEFNGTSSYINCGNDASLNLNDVFTVSILMKTNNQIGSPRLVFKGYNYYIIKYNGEDRLQMRSYDGSITADVNVYNIFDNTLHHIVYTFERGIAAHSYLDGVLIESDLTTPSNSIINTEDLYIGASSIGSYFTGTIKSASIYNRALTAQEAADRYNEVTFNVE